MPTIDPQQWQVGNHKDDFKKWHNTWTQGGYVPDFAAGPQSHAGPAVLALSPAQVRGPSGLARILPRGDGVVQARVRARNFALAFPPGHMAAAAFAVLHGL